MNDRSLSVLATVSPDLSKLVQTAAATLEAQGTFLCVVSGLRTAAQQDTLFAQGRTAPGHIVTNARAGASMHNYGLAVDVVPYLSGQEGAVNWSVETPQYQAMVAALLAQGLIWGGNWTSLKDYDHFQMPGLPVSPNASMEADYKNGLGNQACLANVWSRCTSGAYNG